MAFADLDSKHLALWIEFDPAAAKAFICLISTLCCQLGRADLQGTFMTQTAKSDTEWTYRKALPLHALKDLSH